MRTSIKCPLCHNKSSVKRLCQVSKQNYFPKRNFIYILCKKCGIAFLYPKYTKKDINQIYGKNYYSYSSKPGNKLINFILSWEFSPYAEYICKVADMGTKLLDVGCGTGNFLYQMQKRGWDVYGIEPFQEAVDTSSRKIGNERIFKGELPKLKFKVKNFDVVTLWHVLEHLPNPTIYLTSIHNLLRKGGYLVMEFPNLDSSLFSIFGKSYNWLSHNEHVFYYSKKGVKKFLRDNGFSTLSVYSPMKINSNFAINTANILYNRLSLNWNLAVVIFLPISIFVSFLSSLVGKGEVIRVVARKL